MIAMMRHEISRDRLLRLQSSATVSNIRGARGLRSRRRPTPSLSGGRLRTGGINTRFISPVTFDCSEFSIRRGVADAGLDTSVKITYPTAGVEPSSGSPDLRPRRPVN
jgi:hypothetical protein